MYSYAKLLCDLHADPNVFIPGEQNGITNGVVPTQVDKVSYNERVHTFLLSQAINEPQPQFHVICVRKGRLFKRGSCAKCTVVPVHSQQFAS